MWILALEASTTSAKAMLYDTEKGSFEERVKPYRAMYSDDVLHDAEVVFDCMVELGKELAEGKAVDIISLGGAWHTVMLCDREMKPVTPVYPWSYTGASGVCQELRTDDRFVRQYYQRTGCMVNATYPFFKLLHLKELGYDLTRHRIVGQGTYNNYRLTGQLVTTRCMVSGGGLLNVHTCEYDQESLQYAGVSAEQFARLEDSDYTLPLTEEGAALLGQQAGIPVIITNSDGGLNQLGAGAVSEGAMTFSLGTSGAMRISSNRPMIPETPSTWCYLSPKGWMSGAATAGCCNCIDWFVDNVAGGAADYQQLEGNADQITDTPIFLPFLFGERCPGWNDGRRGGFSGLEARHGLNDMYRGVQQGILFHLYQCYQILTKVSGAVERIKLSGGILHSQVWTQMCADIFGKEMEVDEYQHGSLMGAVVLAREVIGDLQDAGDYEPRQKIQIQPDMARHQLYQQQFADYLSMYHKAE